jgi:hypothetical protein
VWRVGGSANRGLGKHWLAVERLVMGSTGLVIAAVHAQLEAVAGRAMVAPLALEADSGREVPPAKACSCG